MTNTSAYPTHMPSQLGTTRALQASQQQLVMLLRVIERLPYLSEADAETSPNIDMMQRKIEAIHHNHRRISALASELLSECHTEA